MKQQHSEHQQAYEAALAEFRAADTLFAQKHGEYIAARERVNRVRLSLADSETSAATAQAERNEAFRSSDGVVTLDIKRLGSALREANDLVEECRDMLLVAEHAQASAKTQAEVAALNMQTNRKQAQRRFAEMEMQKMLADCAPQLARAFRLFEGGVFEDDGKVRTVSPERDARREFTVALRKTIEGVPPESLELPEDLMKRANIAPLRWDDISIAKMTRDRKLAGAPAASEPNRA